MKGSNSQLHKYLSYFKVIMVGVYVVIGLLLFFSDTVYLVRYQKVAGVAIAVYGLFRGVIILQEIKKQ